MAKSKSKKNNIPIYKIENNAKKPQLLFHGQKWRKVFPKEFNIEWQKSIIEDSKNVEYINIGDLPFILATDELCSRESIIQHLCDMYGLNYLRNPETYFKFWLWFIEIIVFRRRPGKNKNEQQWEDIKNKNIWFVIIYRLIFGFVNGRKFDESLKPIGAPPLVYFNNKTRKLKKYDQEKNERKEALIRIATIERWFGNKLRVPLPRLLFPNEQAIKQTDVKKENKEENYINQFTLAIENDEEIRIKKYGKPAKTYNYQ